MVSVLNKAYIVLKEHYAAAEKANKNTAA